MCMKIAATRIGISKQQTLGKLFTISMSIPPPKKKKQKKTHTHTHK